MSKVHTNVTGRLRGWVRRLRPIHVVPLLAALALSAWAFASPLGASPDDDFHLTSVWCAQGDRAGACEPGDNAAEREVPVGVVGSGCYIRQPKESAACQDRISYDPAHTVETGRGNFIGAYPPVYYAVMSIFVGPDIQVSAVVMRLVTTVLFIALSTLLYMLLPVRRRPALVWGWLISTVPLGLFIIPSNNPSSWAVIGVGLGWLALLGWFETSGRSKIGLGVVFAIATVMAAGSRSDGAIYAVLGMLVVAVLKFGRTRRFLLDAILPVALAVVCAISVFTSSQSASVVSGFDGPSASAVDPGTIAPAVDKVALLAYNLLNVPSIWAGAFGSWGLGWFDTDMPAIVALGSLACFIGVAFAGFGVLSRRKALALAGVGIALVIVPVYVLTAGGDRVGVEVQPRYLLPAIVLFAGLLALSVGDRLMQLRRGQVLLVVITLSVVQFIALHTNLRRYVTGTDDQGFNLDTGAEWWWHLPFSPMVVAIVGSLAYAGAVAILAFAVTPSRTAGLAVDSVAV